MRANECVRERKSVWIENKEIIIKNYISICIYQMEEGRRKENSRKIKYRNSIKSARQHRTLALKRAEMN